MKTAWISTAGLAEQLSAATRDGVAVIGPTGALLFWNAAAQAITGWSRTQAATYVLTAIPDGLSEIRAGKWADTRRFRFQLGADEHVALLFADATAQIELAEANRKLATVGLVHPTTGFPGRELAIDHLSRSLSLGRRDDRAVGILAVGLTPPAATGVEVIVANDLVRQVARRLTIATRTSDFVAHTGEWTFSIILTAMTGGADSAIVVTARLLLMLSQPFVAGGRERTLATAIGVSHGPDQDVGAVALLERAEDAMREARSGGLAYRVWRSQAG